MIYKLLSTNNDIGPTVLRVVLGAVLFAHGAQKLLGWFGGAGIAGTMGFLNGFLHVPESLVYVVIVIEFFGGLGLIFGFLTRLGAFGIAIDMIVAAALVHVKTGFFMDWGGNQKGEGYEFHLLAIAMALTIVVYGAGAASVDGIIASRSPAAGS